MIQAFAILDAVSLVFLVLPHFDIILVRPAIGFILFFFSKAALFRDVASFLDAGVGFYLILGNERIRCCYQGIQAAALPGNYIQ